MYKFIIPIHPITKKNNPKIFHTGGMSTDGSRVLIDKQNPRVEIEITQLEK